MELRKIVSKRFRAALKQARTIKINFLTREVKVANKFTTYFLIKMAAKLKVRSEAKCVEFIFDAKLRFAISASLRSAIFRETKTDN